MATKKKEKVTAEQTYRGALVNLAQLGFEVIVGENQHTARIRHPLAAQYENVSTTKLVYQQFQDRVEVDGKRVALGEVISRAVEVSLADVADAQRNVERLAQQAVKKTERYEAFLQAGLDGAAKGMPFAKRYSIHADRLRTEGDGLTITLEAENTEKPLVLTIEAQNGALPVVVAALKAARKAAKA